MSAAATWSTVMLLPVRSSARASAYWSASRRWLARAELRTGSNFTVDQVAAALTWRGLLELTPLRGPIAELSYRPSYRFADGTRPEAFWRHDLSAAVSYRWGRLTLALLGDLYLPSNSGAATAVRLVARFDFDRRDGLDFSPGDLPLADFALGRSWTTAP